MDITQLLLILTGLAVAAGGVFMLLRAAGAARRPTTDKGITPVRPYVPLGVIAFGLFIAYHAYNDFATLDPSDVTILFAFCVALALLMGLRFFLIDKMNLPADNPRPHPSDMPPAPPDSQPPTS
ncbi:MAG: hypothetical protein ABJA50_03130 [Chloroflexota bacterium]